MDSKGSITISQPDRLSEFDFKKHNDSVRQLMTEYASGRAHRAPVLIGTNTRYFVFNEAANPTGITFRQYIDNPDTMFRARLEFARWARFNILQDSELGLPERWVVGVDFQNFYEAAWFGCPVVYIDDEVPDTLPAYEGDPERFLAQGKPEPFANWMGKVLDYLDRFGQLAEGFEYCGRPVSGFGAGSGNGTDGPMTVACNVLGPTWVCEAMMDDERRLHEVLGLITEATIDRIRAFGAKFGAKFPLDGFWLADDSVALISNSAYREHILPYHRVLYETFGTVNGRGMHLCGNSSRHFKTMVDELNVQAFDTGFPIDFARLREELGPDVFIQGGPHVELVRSGSAEEVFAESIRILESGVREGNRFLLREGNNLAPGTPLENCDALWHAANRINT
jgi:uroporphyrinogen-III decarboxylase